MGVIGGTLKLAGKGTFLVSSFGLGLALFVRPWPDSPIWTKPTDLVGSTKINDDNNLKNSLNNDFKQYKEFQKYYANDKFELLPVDKLIPESHKFNQVSQGLLSLGDPIMMINKTDGESVVFGTTNHNLVGLDGKIHNGIILTLLDESLCFCGFNKLPNKRGVTAKLTVNFDKKLEPNSKFILTSKVVNSRGRKVTIEGNIKSLDNGDTIANAECILVEPKWFKYLSWVELF